METGRGSRKDGDSLETHRFAIGISIRSQQERAGKGGQNQPTERQFGLLGHE